MKIKIPLRIKFLIVTATLIVAAITSYLILAVNLFNSDKTTYVYEGNASLVNAIASETRTNFKSIQKTLNLVGTQLVNPNSMTHQAISGIFNSEDEVARLKIFKKGQYPNTASYEFVRPELVDKEAAAKNRKSDLLYPPVASINDNKPMFFVATKDGMTPLLGMVLKLKSPSGEWIIYANLRQDRRNRNLQRSEPFLTYLVNSEGKVLAHPDFTAKEHHKEISTTQLFQEIKKSQFDTAVRSSDVDGREIIYGFQKINDYNLYVISEIDRKKAFIASQRLIEKSVLMAALIIAICLIVTVIFSKKITASLMRLFQATEEIMRGNFTTQVNVQSQDEVGVLAWSFNRMTAEISRLMAETADKARMEKELETAQLVQDNFFPISELSYENLSLAAFYVPASECGGDWWGSIRMGKELIVLIGDATGHGVPSALITAAAQSCCSTLEAISQQIPNYKPTPAEILSKLNNAICLASRGTVKMSFFCGIINLESGILRYANAAHEMPLICKGDPSNPQRERSKKDIIVCKGQTGNILGHDIDSQYENHEIEFRKDDTLLLYTDGLVECTNAEKQPYGKGRLLRHYSKIANQDAHGIRDQIIADAFNHFGETERADDVTIVVIKLNT